MLFSTFNLLLQKFPYLCAGGNVSPMIWYEPHPTSFFFVWILLFVFPFFISFCWFSPVFRSCFSFFFFFFSLLGTIQRPGFETGGSSTAWEAAEEAMELHTASHLAACAQVGDATWRALSLSLTLSLVLQSRFGDSLV